MKVLNYLLFALLFSFVTFGCGSSTVKDAEISEVKEAAVRSDKAVTYVVDQTASQVLWEGRKSTGTIHHGVIQIKSGALHLESDKITSGKFTIDMTTIKNLDLEGQYKANLEAHLKGTAEGKENDFFNINKYPTAEFEITKIIDVEDDEEANAMVYGNLTIRDISHNIGFKVQIDVDENKIKAFAPQFKIDRTKWDVMFMSKSIMDNIKDGFVNDGIGVSFEITANKQ